MHWQLKNQWICLHDRLLKGHPELLKRKAAEHLFKNGEARSSWADLHGPEEYDGYCTSTPSSYFGSPEPEQVFHLRMRLCGRPLTTRQPPPELPRYEAVLYQYRKIHDPERTIYVQIPRAKDGKDVKPTDIARACRRAVKSGRSDRASAHESAAVRDQDLCIIRFLDRKTADMLAYKTVAWNEKNLEAWPYPSRSPQAYVAHMPQHGGNAVRYDAISLALSDTFPDAPFHLLKEKFAAGMNCAWVVVFEQPPGLLRFRIGIQKMDGGHWRVEFEAVVAESACPVCNRGHAALDYKILESVTREELSLGPLHPVYLDHVPAMA